VLSWGSCPPELPPPRFGVRYLAKTYTGSLSPIRAHPRAPSHRGCMPRPGLRRLSSRAQDPSIRRVYRTPRTTVRRRPSSPSASRALPCASRQPRPTPCRAFTDGASCPCPLFGGTPRLPALGDPVPRKGATTAGPRRRSFVEPLTRPHPLRGRLATGPLAELGLVVPSPPTSLLDWAMAIGSTPAQLALATCTSSVDLPLLRGAGRWWAPLSPGGPTLLGFRPSSTRLGGASAKRCQLIHPSVDPLGPSYGRFAAGETPRHRDAFDPVTPHGSRREGHRLSLSRARRTFVRRGVLRVASFR